MKKALVALLLFCLLPLAVCFSQIRDQHYEIIVELSEIASSYKPELAAKRVANLAHFVGFSSVESRTLFRFEDENKDILLTLTPQRQKQLSRWIELKSDSYHELKVVGKSLVELGVASRFWPKPHVTPAIVVTPEQKAPELTGVEDFSDLQGYLLPRPFGMDVVYAWSQLEGVDITIGYGDVEGAWNRLHLDMPLRGVPIDFAPRKPDSQWFPHGTAVLGILTGLHNEQGVKGLAPDTDINLYSVFRISDGMYSTNVAATLLRAGKELKPGDIMLIEIQYSRIPGIPSFMPIEYYPPEFEAIKQAVEKGIIVVEVAGNGGLNIDKYLAKDGSVPDSGAIIIGAGGVPAKFDGFGPNRNLQRLYFSNYGERVDAQNWGELVVTTGYGDLYAGKNPQNISFTQNFNGTSAASALTAAACVLIQKYANHKLGRPLSPAEMRTMLHNFGATQRGDAESEPIGRRPNLRAIFQKIRDLAKNGRYR
jgi:hypothetical protein